MVSAAPAPARPGPPGRPAGDVTVEAAPGVWVAWARTAAVSEHPADLADVRGRPRWRRRQSLAARGLLRALLAEVCPGTEGVALSADVRGRPALQGLPALGVSLSHDGPSGTSGDLGGDLVAAAVAPGRRVGVDVQLPPGPDVPAGLVRRCLRERAGELSSLPAGRRALEFAWVWTVQEACVKADGTGIAGRPWSLDIPVRPGTGTLGDLTWIALRHLSVHPVSCAFGDLRAR
ncbi:4'-phosphopantetheinyl transferase [Streptomyces collinus Tu 365]|uniref:4'-phosphopantetheinyl transferase n=1 Tax=Streptomyces collinus (strain DSM 40733 / Tue 365) TaxID=1214242 RepID=S5W0F5_STRC3|nr:4'-phosphopantetheinyl transferase [Streptomyces collinus Tu 365]AGS73760.1 4'-phosphopantetheinyl transferase [Streptomyces collinus Tu 365]